MKKLLIIFLLASSFASGQSKSGNVLHNMDGSVDILNDSMAAVRTAINNIVISNSAPTFINLADNFSSTSTTPAAVTGWSFAVTSGSTYRIEVIASYQTAATTTGGIFGISLTNATGTVRGAARGTVSASAVATELAIPIRATSGAGSTLTTTGVSATNTPHAIGMLITFTCTGSGTFNIVWGTEVNASAAQLNANSSLIYQALN